MEVVRFEIYLLVGLNLFLSVIIVVWDLYFFFKMKGIEQERWAKLLYAMVGFLWGVRYSAFFLDIYPYGHSDPFNISLLILGALTLLCLAIGSIIRVQRLGGFPLISSDLRKLIPKIR